MPRTFSRTKKRGRSSISQTLRRKREEALRVCLSDEYVPEDSHLSYYDGILEDELPELEIEKDENAKRNVLEDCRIVNINYFIQEVKKLTFHDFKCTMGNMKFVKEIRNGIESKLKYYCETCSKTLYLDTHPQEHHPYQNPNESLIWGSLSIGIGFSQLQELLSILNVPSLTRKTFVKHEKKIGDKWETELCSQMKKAADEEKKLAIADGNIENGLPYITVIVDGGWAKRSYGHSYSSMSGVACIIGEKTKKLLFVGVRNKFCYSCATKSSNEHVCYLNYKGPSTSMEQHIIINGFNRSEKEYGLCYKYLIGDGDSSVYAQVLQNVSYGRYVHKLECANHITKAFTSNLHKSAMKTTFNIEARRILKARMTRFTIGVRTAIAKSTNVHFLKQDLKNLPYHVFGSHNLCRNEVCKRKLDNEENVVPLLKQSNLFQEVEKSIDNIVRKADRLQRNVTTNHAERYMSLIAKFSGGKRVNYTTSGSYGRRCLGAGLAYNLGPSWHLSMINKTQVRYLCRSREQHRVYKQTVRKSLKRKRQAADFCADRDYGPNAQQALPDLTDEELKAAMNNKLLSLEQEKNNAEKIQADTIGQSANSLWYDIRIDRLTASEFGKVCLRRKTTSCHELIKRMLYTVSTKDATNLPAPLKYGRMNENRAIQLFTEKMGLQVIPCGFFIYKRKPFIGASPDGLVGENAIVEVKCLYSIRDQHIKKSAKNNKKLCVQYNIKDGTLNLKKNHHYYYQVQGQLNITDRELCYFVLFTDIDCEIIKIEKDSEFWENDMLPKLSNFWLDCVLPELADPRLPRGLRIRDSTSIVEAQQEKIDKARKKLEKKETNPASENKK